MNIEQLRNQLSSLRDEAIKKGHDAFANYLSQRIAQLDVLPEAPTIYKGLGESNSSPHSFEEGGNEQLYDSIPPQGDIPTKIPMFYSNPKKVRDPMAYDSDILNGLGSRRRI